MRKTFILLLIAAIMSASMAGCSDDFGDENAEPATRAASDEGPGEEIPEGLYYDEEIGMWVVPLDVPEENGTSEGDIGITTMTSIVPNPNPGPYDPGGYRPPIKILDGYYLKIWPQNQEQWELLMDMESEGVILSYHSFGTAPLSTSTLTALGLANQAPAVNRVRFFEYEEEYDDGNGNILAARNVPMPVLYADWPLFLPFPEWMIYEITEEKFIWLRFEDPQIEPPGNGGTGGSGGNDGSTRVPYRPLVTIQTWDSVLNRYVAIPNLPIFIQASYSNYEKGRTDANGQYQCKNTYTKSNKFTVTIDWDHGDFYIIKNEKLAQYTHQTYPDTWVKVQVPEIVHATIFRAAEWFAENKAIHKLRASFGFPGDNKIRIYDKTHMSNTVPGTFHTNESKCRISIYNHDTDAYYRYFQTTMHELGHASMCRSKGKWKYADTGSMIKESWASFVEWYMTPLAYQTWGFRGDIVALRESRQSWRSSGQYNSHYSPLFIDLMDDENQFYSADGLDPTLPDDRIKNVPVLVIQSISQNSYACQSFKSEAGKYMGVGIGRYYTEQEFADYFLAYEEGWVYGGDGWPGWWPY